MNANLSHQIAVKAASQLIKDGVAGDLSWTDIAISCETVVAAVVMACAEMSGASSDTRFATEVIDTITERAHQRVTATILGGLYD